LPAAVVVIFFLAVTIPLCGSRSCSLLAILLLVAALIHGLVRIVSHRHEDGRAAFKPATALVLVALVAFVSLFTLARPSIESRINDSQNQLLQMRSEGSIGGRATLYRDTWRMACDRPWFGWGLGSYGTVFMRYNTQTSPVDRLPVYYQDAHSDWLQLFAETGAIGTILLLGFLLVPVFQLRQLRQITALPRYLLGGCGLILLYAGIEFPFGNPAVTIAFWTCFFAAVRWAQIDQREHTG
jgi:O-antigen ligase